MLNFENPACGECAEGMCCAQLQACFGDETVMEMTDCATLNNCIGMNCGGATTVAELQMCVEAMCAETAGELMTFLGINACLGMNCAAACA